MDAGFHDGRTQPQSQAFSSAEPDRAGAPLPEPKFSAQEAESPDAMTAAAQGRLKSLVERLERLDEDKAAVVGDIKLVYAEAKGEGFDPKIIRKVIRLKKMDADKRAEEEALTDLYLNAIGGL